MTELTAEQKIKQQLAGDPEGEIHFQHEGEDTIRWLTGGTLPDAWATFTQEGDAIVVRCAGCKNILGYLPANRDPEQTAKALLDIRLAGHELHKPENWPQ